jgi:hypothetical protein
MELMVPGTAFLCTLLVVILLVAVPTLRRLDKEVDGLLTSKARVGQHE